MTGKKLGISLLILVLLLSLLGSAIAQEEEMELGNADELVPTDEEVAAAVEALGDDGLVGIIACTYSTEWHFTAADSARQRLEELGVTVEAVDSEINPEKQISAIENFTSKGAKVIIVCLFDPPSVQSALEEAADAGVMIVQYAGRQLADLGGVTISAEDEDMGLIAGEYAAQLITDEMDGEANVAILDYPDIANVVVRADAIAAALAEGAPDAVIVGNYLGGTTEFGLASMESALVEHPEINVVVSINDAGAYGALQALENTGVEDAIIVGIDAEQQAVELIKAGGMYRGTVSTAPANNGIMAANAAVKLLAGAELEHQNFAVPLELVTAETLAMMEEAMPEATEEAK